MNTGSWVARNKFFLGTSQNVCFLSMCFVQLEDFVPLSTQYQTRDLTEKWESTASLQAEQQFSVFRGSLTLLCCVSRAYALR